MLNIDSYCVVLFEKLKIRVMKENRLRALDSHHDLYCDLNFDIHENIQTLRYWPTSLIVYI